jgi:hypothetical protein
VANEYITSAELKAAIQVTGTVMDDDLNRAIGAASRAVEKACSRRGLRRFWADTAYAERIYTPRDPDLLEIHDAFDIQLVESDEDGDGTYERVWDASEWLPIPLNAAIDGEPWTAIQWRSAVTPAATKGSGFPDGVLAGVRVTAKYGWESIPEFVPQATLLIASRLAKRSREAPFAVVGFGIDQAAVHIAKTDPDVAGLIHDYVRDTSARSIRLG